MSNPLPNISFWVSVRQHRDRLLRDSDWTQFTDSPLSETKKSEWATYRQSLRDVPANNSSATIYEEVTFPSEPS